MSEYKKGDLVRITTVYKQEEKCLLGMTATVISTDTDGDVWLDIKHGDNNTMCCQYSYGWDIELVK